MNSKITSLIINALIIIVAIIGVYFVLSAMGNKAVIDPITQQANIDTSTVSRAVNFSLIVLVVSLGAIALFTLFAMITNPKRFIPTTIGIAVFAVLVFIGYTMTTVETSGPIMALEGSTEPNLLWGGVGINTTYVLVIVAIGLIIIQGVRGLVGYFTK